MQAAKDGREEGFSHQQDLTDMARHLGLLAGMEVTMLQGHFGSGTLQLPEELKPATSSFFPADAHHSSGRTLVLISHIHP